MKSLIIVIDQTYSIHEEQELHTKVWFLNFKRDYFGDR